jgi:Bacterial Ig-like domain (group 2)
MNTRLFPLLSLLTLTLAACGGTGSIVPAITGLTVSSVTAPVKVGDTLQLSVTNTRADGSTVPASGVLYTSSNPQAVSVNGEGLITARHLTVTEQPVTITAISGGLTSRVTVTTYGLDVVTGTYVTYNADGSRRSTDGVTPDPVRQFIVGRYRDAAGQAAPAGSTYTVGSEAARTLLNSDFIAIRPLDSAALSVTVSVGGTTYAQTITAPNPNRLIGPFTGTFNSTRTTYSITGTLAPDQRRLDAQIGKIGTAADVPYAADEYAAINALTTLPATGGYATPLQAGEYTRTIIIRNYTTAMVLPDEANIASTYLSPIALN